MIKMKEYIINKINEQHGIETDNFVQQLFDESYVAHLFDDFTMVVAHYENTLLIYKDFILDYQSRKSLALLGK